MNSSHKGEPVLSNQDGFQKERSFAESGHGRDFEATSLDGSGRSTLSSAQAGVKNIEAVSMTWTKWGLIAAYARFVILPNLRY
jgi:hypothetical protein